MKNYLLVYDAGSLVFTSINDAKRYANILKKQGHRIDRIQVNRYMGKTYKTKAKVIKQFY